MESYQFHCRIGAASDRRRVRCKSVVSLLKIDMLEFGTKAVDADLPDEHVVSVKAKIFSRADLFDLGLMDHGGVFSFSVHR